MPRVKRKPRPDPVLKLASTILPPEQAKRGDLRLIDVSNHSDADQRHMVRSGETKTLRRLSHIERLGLDEQELAACLWYADQHAARYHTLGVIAKYGDGGKSGTANFDHMPKTPEQDIAAGQFSFARSGICPTLRPMFERVVIHGYRMLDGQATVLFKLAARQLMHRIEGWL